MIVEDLQPVHAQASPCIIEIDIHGFMPDRNGPKHAVRIDVRIVIMDLLRQISRSNWTGEEIDSDKGERARMTPPVCANELALIETHIGRERKIRRNSRCGVSPNAAAPNAGDAYESPEIIDLGRFVDVYKRDAWSRRHVVDENSEGGEWSDSLGNWVRV